MFMRSKVLTAASALAVASMLASVAFASHSWGIYHWGRTANPFTLKLGDNVSTAWDAHLATASSDWSQSSVVDTTVVSGQTNPRVCRATSGRVEVCNYRYGNNGWLGVASIWVSGSHITKGTVKVNDTYFNTATYNTPAWKRFVMCQEIGHTFGLDHQDVDFNNVNLGSCMDYTGDPDGTIKGQLSNEHPNAHDYEQLEAIYAHLDAGTTVFSSKAGAASAAGRHDAAEGDVTEPQALGEVIRRARDGRSSVYVRDLGRGEQVFTFIIWAD